MSSKLSRFLDRKRAAAHWATVESDWEKKPLVSADQVSDEQLTIIVSTYHERFESCLTRIIKQLSTMFSGTRIIVVANGNNNQKLQSEYLAKLDAFVAELPCVDVIKHVQPVGLAQMWNAAIEDSLTEMMLVLNDDLILEEGFAEDIKSMLKRRELQIINKSWSHFIVTREIIQQVGWFDERFTGIGNEDWDYEARLALANLPQVYRETEHVFNEVLKPREYSYGPEMEIANTKYSQSNMDFFNKKWDCSETEKEGFVYVPGAVCYVKPKLDELSFRFE